MPPAKPVYLSPDQWRQRIVVELNGGAILQQHIRVLWDGNDRLSLTPYVQYLVTKNDAIDLLLGNLDEEEQFPVTGDKSSRLSERHRILLDLRRRIEESLTRLKYGAAIPAMGLLTATAPIPSPAGAPDANDTALRGDPNTRLPWVVEP